MISSDGFSSTAWRVRKSCILLDVQLCGSSCFPHSYGVLTRHRFASHVCQTLFSVARDTINREVSYSIVRVNLRLKLIAGVGYPTWLASLLCPRRASKSHFACLGYLCGVSNFWRVTTWHWLVVGTGTRNCIVDIPSFCFSCRSEPTFVTLPKPFRIRRWPINGTV